MKNTKLFISCIAALFAAGSVHAATVTWDGGGGDSEWTTATNWDTDSLPTASDDLVIGADVNLTSGNQTIISMQGVGNQVLVVDGAGVSLTATGNENGNDNDWAGITASGGATVDLQNMRFNNAPVATALRSQGGSTFNIGNINGTLSTLDIIVSGASTFSTTRYNMNNGGTHSLTVIGPDNTVEFTNSGDAFHPNNGAADFIFNFTMSNDQVNPLSTVRIADTFDPTEWGGGIDLNVDGTLNAASFGSQFVLIDADAIVGSPADLDINLANVSGTITYDVANGDVILTVYGSVPEPTTFSLLFSGLLVLRYSRRFKRG